MSPSVSLASSYHSILMRIMLACQTSAYGAAQGRSAYS